MKLDYLKEKKELVSVVLLGAESLVKTAIEHNNTDPNDMDKYFAKYKVLADALKKNNLFVPPAEKQHPVQEVLGILGNEVLIKDKWYEVGDTVGEAKIVAIGPTQATIEWDGKEKTFAPIDAAIPQAPKGSKAGRAAAKSSESKGGSAQMVAVQSQGRPTGDPGGGPGGGMEKMKERFQNGGGIERMTERFQNMSGADKDKFMAVMKERSEEYKKMSEAEKIQFKSEMIEKFSGGGPGGGKQNGK